jgi:hypothetical protein
LNHAFKTGYPGDVLIYDPDHVKGSANPDNGSGGLYLETLFPEFHKVIYKYLELSQEHPEAGISLFFLGVEVKLV